MLRSLFRIYPSSFQLDPSRRSTAQPIEMRAHSWNPSRSSVRVVGTKSNVPSPLEGKHPMWKLLRRSASMNAISISVGLLIALVGVLLFYMMRKVPQIAGYGSQRMCPSCGLITPRLRACCLECGKSLTAVSVTPILEK